MSLRLKLRPGEKLIINGCILVNGPQRASFEVVTRADVLRGDEILEARTATTPARRLGLQIQVALVSPADRAQALEQIGMIAKDLSGILLAERGEQLATVIGLVESGEFYKAWRATIPLIRHEDVLMRRIRETEGNAA